MRGLGRAGLAIAAMMMAWGLAGPAVAGPRPVPTETIYVASTRLFDGPGSRATQSDGRLHFDAYSVGIPHEHRPGGISPDFAINHDHTFGDRATAFARAVLKAARSRGTSDVVVMVPGYNTGFAEALIRMGQIEADFDFSAPMVMFAWHSANRLDAYDADVVRAGEATAQLEVLLRALTAAGASRIVLVGHSLGAKLAVDGLVRLKANGRDAVLQRLGGVVLLSPDMATDDFTAAMKRLGGTARKVTLFASHSDVALHLLRVVSDGRERVGAVEDPALLKAVPVTLIDVTAAGGLGLAGHFAAMTQPSVISAINAMKRPDLALFAEQARKGGVPGAEVTRFGNMTFVALPKMR